MSDWPIVLERDLNLFVPAAPSAPSSGDLDAAWREVEAALPEDGSWRITALEWPTEKDDEWQAMAAGDGAVRFGFGPTPAAALHALAARLASQPDPEARE